MLRRIRRRITFSNVTAVIALFVALGGSVYAANKINGKRIKRGSLPANRIVPNTVKGKQVREGALGQVPRAGSASSAGVANAAFTTFRFDAQDIPTDPGPIGGLQIPSAGSYVITAKFTALAATANNIVNGRCTLTAGDDVDNSDFDAEAVGVDDTEQVYLEVAHTFDGPATVVLACEDNDGDDTAQALYTRITAVQARELTEQAFAVPIR